VKRIAVLQSNYIPWKGYFDIIRSVDEFVIYDEVQYTRRDWRNRNLIKTRTGTQWLTIPVVVKGKFRQNIRDVKVERNNWTEKHLCTIYHNYSRAPFFSSLEQWLKDLYNECSKMELLSDINRHFILEIVKFLGISARIRDSANYPSTGSGSQKILEICRMAGASEYLSGPSAKAYLDEEIFMRNNIGICWADYEGYREYPQLFPPFIHRVSILDLILNTGSSSPLFMKSPL
jgi:hypothetical protein